MKFHPEKAHFVTARHDRTVLLCKVETGQVRWWGGAGGGGNQEDSLIVSEGESGGGGGLADASEACGVVKRRVGWFCVFCVLLVWFWFAIYFFLFFSFLAFLFFSV